MHTIATQYRKNKTEAPANAELSIEPSSSSATNVQNHCETENWQLVLRNAEGSYTQAKDGRQDSFPVQELHGATEHTPLDKAASQSRDAGIIRHSTSIKEKDQGFRSIRETELLSLYDKFKDVLAKRVQVRQSRMALRFKREDELELRAKFMKHLNTFFANLDHPAAESIMKEYELLQAATEEYLRMENSYRQEEDQLEEQEYILSLSMDPLANAPGIAPVPYVPTPPELWDQYLGQEPSRAIPSCVMSYLSRIGDERMLQERLSELESEWFITIERRDQRRNLHIPLDEDSEEFLRTFDEERGSIWKELNNAQLDVNTLRGICIDFGYSNFDYEDLSSLNMHQFVEEDTWEPERDLLKLPPQHEFHFSPETHEPGPGDGTVHDLDRDTPRKLPMRHFEYLQRLEQTNSISSPEYINTWMLHQLRISSMGIWQLQRFIVWQPLREQGWQDHDISQHVLDGWYADETALAHSSPSSYLNHNTVIFNGDRLGPFVRSSSMPSTPRSSAVKLRQRRHSRA
ncbi:hypothetical protein BJX61DRAFT_75363 [Aspergillus egyptiacus]|nr:hypothetical protein BJX61DRAFT_75363 [Aspergillus egyptiacus]